jgi:hypothetical protein
LLVDFGDKTPLTPINETVEDTEDVEDVEETLDSPNVKGGKHSEYEDIGMGVLVEGTEDGTDHANSKVINKDPDLEEFTLISNSVSELIYEGDPAASMTGMFFPCPITACRSHCHRQQGRQAQGRSHHGRPKEEAEDCLNLRSCC